MSRSLTAPRTVPRDLVDPETPSWMERAWSDGRDRLAILLRAAREIGDVSHLKFGLRDFYLLAHPDAIQHVLVARHRNYLKGPDHVYLKPVIGEGLITSEGAFHLQQRRLIQPAFHRTRVAAYARAMTAYAEDMLDGWQPGETRDMAREMTQLALRIVIQTLLGVDIERRDDPEAQATRAALELFGAARDSMLPNARRASRQLDEIIYAMIRRRRDSGQDSGDILSVLLAAPDDARQADAHAAMSMSDRQVRDEIMTLFFAGHDTTAAALSWAWYLLSQYPDAEAALHAEVDTVLAGRVPTVEDVPRLPYTTAVFAEAMRLYPPVWGITRQTVADDAIGRYRIPAGTRVMVCPYVTHRDPRLYADPERFDPDRFHPDHDVRKTLPRYAYLPFGGGIRQCMGEPFAWMEGTLLLATIARRYRFTLVPGHTVVPLAMITVRPANGVRVTLRSRE